MYMMCVTASLSPSPQLTAPVLHKVLGLPELQPLVWGGKGVGSQGDGTAQLLCKGEQEQRKVWGGCIQSLRAEYF